MAAAVSTLSDRFKAYLQEEFHKITPTKAAMEFRKKLLVEMLDREQELKIKGVTDDELIFKLVVEGLGDLPARLDEFEHREVRSIKQKRYITVAVSVASALLGLVALIYVIVGVTTKAWHPTWLLLVGAAFLEFTAGLVFLAVLKIKQKKYVLFRLLVAAVLVLFSVYVYLLLELVFPIGDGCYLTFLAMIPLVLGVDTTLAFVTSNKLRWVELPIFIEVFGVMLYVILGLILDPILHTGVSFWHPGWLLCLMGVICALVEGIVFLVTFSSKRAKKEKNESDDLNKKVDEKYWTEW